MARRNFHLYSGDSCTKCNPEDTEPGALASGCGVLILVIFGFIMFKVISCYTPLIQ